MGLNHSPKRFFSVTIEETAILFPFSVPQLERQVNRSVWLESIAQPIEHRINRIASNMQQRRTRPDSVKFRLPIDFVEGLELYGLSDQVRRKATHLRRCVKRLDLVSVLHEIQTIPA